ncbi:MAG: N-6 DNA methylase [Pseudomonadota bacterium]
MKIEQSARHHQTQYSEQQRKLLGIHYTPDSVIDYIIRHTILSYLEKNNFVALRQIKILDPACGSGLFLLKAFDLLCSLWQQQFGKLNANDIRYILENNLYGVDIEHKAIHETKQQLEKKGVLVGVKGVRLSIQQGDALLHSFAHGQINLLSDNTFNWQENFATVFAQGGFDCVIGNPPYIRIQHVQRRIQYVERYQTARGRFDLAGLFIELGHYLLKPEGQLGYITSNKLLTTQGAKALRAYILEHYNLIEIINLTDTKLFEAAILPMILIMEKPVSASNSFLYTSIQEMRTAPNTYLKVDDLFELLNQQPRCECIKWQQRYFQIEQFETALPSMNQSVWTFHAPKEHQLIEKLKKNAVCTLGDISKKISVGLKTTADKVFIKPMTLDFINHLHFESTVVFPLLESHNVFKWHCDWQEKRDLYVLYPYQYQNNKLLPIDLNLYPNTKQYLLSHQKQLEARTYLKKSGRQWYEIWVHQSPADFKPLKIITPDISTHNRFALDDKGLFVNGTCFYILLKEVSVEHYLLVLSLLNSSALEFFHKVTSGNTLYSKRFRYWTSYLKFYPIPDFRHAKNITTVNQLIANTRILLQTTDKQKQKTIEQNNDQLIYRWFGLVDDDIKEIEKILRLHKA